MTNCLNHIMKRQSLSLKELQGSSLAFSCLIHNLILEMFHLFQEEIRDCHLEGVFTAMENIMTIGKYQQIRKQIFIIHDYIQ